jgi:hypothetical protein
MKARREVWAERELGEAKLGDKRRTARAVEIVGARAKQPGASLPNSLGAEEDVKAGYRFYENDEVSAESLQKAHAEQTVARARAWKGQYVLAIQDTMHVEFGREDVWVHSTMMATADRVPLGMLGQQIWERPAIVKSKQKHHKHEAIQDKESSKWLRGLALSAEAQSGLRKDQRVVCVADRESDIFEVLAEAERLDVKVLIRGVQERKIAEEAQYLQAHVKAQPVAGQMQVTIQRNAERAAREAVCEVRYATATIQIPMRLVRGKMKRKELRPIQVNVIHVNEINAPAEVGGPIEWLLLTTFEIADVERACEWVRMYAVRWLIEMYHKVLKSGCQIEHRQFESLENFARYFAIDAIVAWRVLHITLAARVRPDMPCSEVLDEHEWQALYVYKHHKPPPAEPPALKDAVRWVASLGGYLGRKNDGPPGTKVIWGGLSRIPDIALGYFLQKSMGKG